MILPGVIIHKGAIIGAGSIVTRDVSYLNIVAGIPAKKINIRPANFNYSAQYTRLFQ